MPYKYSRSVTLPKVVVDEAENWLDTHREVLRKRGIKKISHVFERAWYFFNENNKDLIS